MISKIGYPIETMHYMQYCLNSYILCRTIGMHAHTNDFSQVQCCNSHSYIRIHAIQSCTNIYFTSIDRYYLPDSSTKQENVTTIYNCTGAKTCVWGPDTTQQMCDYNSVQGKLYYIDTMFASASILSQLIILL